MDRISSVKFAMDNEQREKDFYLKEAARSNNPVVKRLLETLAAEEEDHKTWIAQLHSKLIADGAWPEDVDLEMKDSNVNEELKKLDYKAEETKAHDDNDIEALTAAVQFEKDAAEFYAELVQKCDNPKEQVFFKFLSKIERDHMLSIEDSLSYLKDPEAWFDATERHGLDGA
ncbi:MAG: ferritin family protein [Deltaproteobacteria bacterium]|nr:ferritin family protein [Deltaproteobacteria bacterium]MBN2674093.1 ferritin family protein [Deltaproteobacteria bacterium]